MNGVNLAKAISMAAAAASLLLLVPAVDPAAVGVSSGCPFTNRLLYHFFHAGALHALLNAWCLLAIVFGCRARAVDLCVAYAAASLVPSFTFAATPTIGLSGVIYALLGIMVLRVPRKARLLLWCLAYIAAGFLFPSVNAALHAACFATGAAAAVFYTPFKCRTP